MTDSLALKVNNAGRVAKKFLETLEKINIMEEYGDIKIPPFMPLGDPRVVTLLHKHGKIKKKNK